MSDSIEKKLWEEVKAERAEKRALESRIRSLEKELAPVRDAEALQARLSQAVHDAKPRPWLKRPAKGNHVGPGVPVLFLSDLHMNEEVRPEDVAGRNRFNPDIADERLERVFQGAFDIAFQHMVLPNGWKYPGIVIALGGDNIDNLLGNYHASDRHAGYLDQAVARCTNGLAQGIAEARRRFGNVLVVCVPGNHGRTTPKMPSVNAGGTSLDNIIYGNLRNHRLLSGPGIDFVISGGVEARFKVYDHAFVLTHGYQWRGGDGEIGSLGPVTRGVKRLRSKYRQMGLDVDTVLVAHFHQYHPSQGFIMNGSLKGYDALAMQLSFAYEPPIQALFFVHPDRGITCQWPVHAEPKAAHKLAAWAAVEGAV